MKYLNLLSSLMLLVGISVVAESTAAEYACVENMLCNEVKHDDAALFEKYFGREMAPVTKAWDTEALIEYSSSWGRNEAGKTVLRERIMQLAEDGSTLRHLSCVRFKNSDGRRVNYKERVQYAVFPYLFISNLVKIVDYKDQCVFFELVKFNPQTRRIEAIECEKRSFAELKANFSITDIKPEHEQILARYFTGCTDEMPAQWDSAQRVRYSAHRIGTRGKPGYKLVARVEQIAEDGGSFLFIEKELEKSKGNKICLDCAVSSKAVYPGVFAAIMFKESLMILHVPENELGVRLKPRFKRYRADTLELESRGQVE